MTQPTSYPSPTAAHDNMHPFYNANQHHMPPAEHSHIPPPASAPMREGAGDTRDFLQGNGNGNGQGARQPQPSTQQQLAQRGLDADQSQDQNNPDSSRKRSKVSRACDECRRKKVGPVSSQTVKERKPIASWIDTM